MFLFDRLKESGAINTSLFALGQVVDALNQRLVSFAFLQSTHLLSLFQIIYCETILHEVIVKAF